MKEEFKEIAHSGGQFIVSIKTGENGQRSYSLGYSGNRPVPMKMIALWATGDGIPVAMIKMGGIGTPWNPPPVPAQSIFIASDSEGMFGHQCPRCQQYWRSTNAPAIWPLTCSYCGLRESTHVFLSEGQEAYVRACSRLIIEKLNFGEDGEHKIDMDAVADAVGKDTQKPAFYYADVSQQNKFRCDACGEGNDILGKYGFCSCCGTRNDLQMFKAEINSIRQQARASAGYSGFVKDAVSTYDAACRAMLKHMVASTPLTKHRRSKADGFLFHSFGKAVEMLKEVFDVKLDKGLSADDQAFATKMFCRRHVYEHNGGEVDQRYLDESGDQSVRLKQSIREDQANVFRLCNILERMAENLHEGFHELFPPIEGPIKSEQEKRQRLAERQSRMNAGK